MADFDGRDRTPDPVTRRNTPAERRKAALYVAGHATDIDDAALLLDALGLREEA